MKILSEWIPDGGEYLTGTGEYFEGVGRVFPGHEMSIFEGTADYLIVSAQSRFQVRTPLAGMRRCHVSSHGVFHEHPPAI